MREQVAKLTAQYGEVPPPWLVFNEHPYSICWRMGGGEGHIEFWGRWWNAQRWDEARRIAYFQKWMPPACWMGWTIEAIWDLDLLEEESDAEYGPYFARLETLGFPSQADYEKDLEDPKWLDDAEEGE